MYTVQTPDGERDLSFEHGLCQLETGMRRLRLDFLEARKQLPPILHLKLVAFIAAMQCRTPRFRDHHREQWQRILDTGAEIERSMQQKTPEERARIASMSLPRSSRGERAAMDMDDVQRIVDYPIQAIAPAAIEAQLPFLLQMKLGVFCSSPGTRGFITSDSPVVWFDPESRNRPLMWRGPALMFESIQISMPMSPRQMLIIMHDQPMSRGIKPIAYVDVDDEFVDALNRRTRFYASEEVVSNGDGFDSRWNSSKPTGDG